MCLLWLIYAQEARITCALSASSILLNYLSQVSQYHSDEKVIEREQYPGEPVEIENLAVKNVKVALHQKFSAKSLAEQGGGLEDDWLENLEFTIRNTSDKRITYLAISLGFPRPGNTDTSVGTFYHFVFGIDLRASGEPATLVEPFSLSAGGSYAVRVSEKDLKEIKNRLMMSKTPLADVNKIILRVPAVGYEDGVQWQLGQYSIPEKQARLDKKVIERVGYDIEPYEIGDLSVKNVRITSRERLVTNGFNKVLRDSYEFSSKAIAHGGIGQEGDWLERLEFTCKNRSAKRVIYIGLDLGFPETEVIGPQMIYRISKGEFPQSNKTMLRPTEPLLLEAGEVTTLTLSAQQLKALKDFLGLRKFQLADLNKAVLGMTSIFYEDGTKWSQGNYYKPNADKPGGYEKLVQ